jgi:hypothetical protein
MVKRNVHKQKNIKVSPCDYYNERMDLDGGWCWYCSAPEDYKCAHKKDIRDCDNNMVSLCFFDEN